MQWLIWSCIGVLFALLPIWWCFAGRLSYAILYKKRKVPPWMFKIAGGKIETGETHLKRGIFLMRHAYIPSRILSIFFVFGPIILYHYRYWDILSRGTTFNQVIILETSFPLFLLLTWLIPIYFIERYFRRLERGSENKT